MKKLFMLLMLLAFSSPLWADDYNYVEGGQTGAGTISKVYSSTALSFIYFSGDMGGRCAYNGGGMYLGDPDTTTTSSQAARLLATALSAKLNNKNVVLNYKYATEGAIVGAAECYAYGVTIQD